MSARYPDLLDWLRYSLVYFKFADTGKHDTNNILIAQFAGQFNVDNYAKETLFVDPEAIYLIQQDSLFGKSRAFNSCTF